VGWVRFFTKQPVLLPDDMKRVKLFTWSGGTSQADLMKGFGWNPVLLETADILPSLQTGLIDGVPTVPYIALKGQFFSVASHMLELDWAPLVGALVVSRKAWEELPPPLREHCKAAATKSVEAMRKRGLVVHALTPEQRAAWRAFVEPIWPRLRGLDVPAELYDELMRTLGELRGAGPK
jgi:TRAP-type C4-dicarboxylate transport system substrate-binding protein